MSVDVAEGDIPTDPGLCAESNTTEVPAEDDDLEAGLWDNDLESIPDSEFELTDDSDIDQTDLSISSDEEDEEINGPHQTAPAASSSAPRQSRYRHCGGPYRNERGRYVVEHPTAAAVVSFKGETARARFGRDKFSKQRKKCLYYPFKSAAEAEIALMLDDSGMSNKEIDAFLKSQFVKSNKPLSFRSAQRLRQLIEMLPAGSQWKWKEIKFEGYETKSPLVVYYRDGLECIESLFADPRFVEHLDLIPRREYLDEEHSVRTYNEMMTGQIPWEVQDCLPEGATSLGVVMSSDKTQLSQGTGNAAAHPILLSLGNIKSSIRNSGSSHAFLLAALIPIPSFLEKDDQIRAVLEQRLLHECYDTVTASLKEAARNGHKMSNAIGEEYLCFPWLASVMVDLPEAIAIAGVMANQSPTFVTGKPNFGDPLPGEPRRGTLTMQIMEEIVLSGVDPDANLRQFITRCREKGLSGVWKPFWRDWRFADPYIFISPDALHGLHKQFFDHDLKWALKALTAKELDFRFKLLQPRVGFRRFSQGVSSLKQITMREVREMEKYFIGCMDSELPTQFLDALRALMDFRYRTQAEDISEPDVSRITASLSEFHRLKSIINDPLHKFREVKGWQIPKLERMHHIIPSIRMMGAPHQYSTDRTENAHIEVVKVPYRLSSRRNNPTELVRILDRMEKRLQYLILVSLEEEYHLASTVSVDDGLDSDDETDENPRSKDSIEETVGRKFLGTGRKLTDYFRQSFEMEQRRSQPRVPGVRLRLAFTFCTPSTAFHFAYTPNISSLPIDEAARLFGIGDLRPALGDFYRQPKIPSQHVIGGRLRSSIDCQLPFSHIRIWYRMRIQTRDQFGTVLPSEDCQASPPSDENTRGLYDTVIAINDAGGSLTDTAGDPLDIGNRHFVGQLRILFQPIYSNSLRRQGQQAPYLAYMERFDVVPQIQPDRRSLRQPHRVSGMFVLQRAIRSNGSRMGGIVNLSVIRRPAYLIPRFGKNADHRLTCSTSLELSTQFFLNKYTDKHIFHLLDH
ncbi:hypothetical protein SISNIDRAFT_417979 [Sistotremastrum niveocremeum HHB9708]|uniref:DUF6830 domain-containing protein n=2 Tax=Sistotremastraceae TaxID=3402574 RepID=A0A164PAF1_9AGAM|nr:hypothetical protein SISNIDRAFT_417979 [Sistotremastrum niveocremeum HHB9708]KZT33066.1 hypothetical protein SISSUDRAFT_993463 [Sistotremastrum suecicum HHB10207 ss-3]